MPIPDLPTLSDASFATPATKPLHHDVRVLLDRIEVLEAAVLKQQRSIDILADALAVLSKGGR